MEFLVGFRLCPSDFASSSSYGLVNVPSIVWFECVVLDLLVEMIKKRKKKTYELIEHFQNVLVAKFPWVKSVLNFDVK
jgi:hypothetical protein